MVRQGFVFDTKNTKLRVERWCRYHPHHIDPVMVKRPEKVKSIYAQLKKTEIREQKIVPKVILGCHLHICDQSWQDTLRLNEYILTRLDKRIHTYLTLACSKVHGKYYTKFH